MTESRGFERAVRLAMRADKIGSDWYVTGGFAFAPVLIVLGRWWPAALPYAVGVIVTGAVALGLLGFCMAGGLVVLARRGVRMDEQWWDSILPGVARHS